MGIRETKPLIERLQNKLKATPNGCWEWQGATAKEGYGHITRGRRGEGIVRTHRAMWEIVFGPIPDGLCILHRCDNPPCANPAHLFLGTRGDNNADMVAKGRNVVQQAGEGSNTKLTWKQVRAIRADGRRNCDIGVAYGIDHSHIGKIKRGERWKE